MMVRENLLRYLAGILSIELDLFVQKNAIEELTRHYNSLGVREKIHVPQRGKPQSSIMSCMIIAGIICAIVAGVIGLIHEWSRAEVFFYYIAAIIAALIYATGGLLVGAVVFGSMVWLILRIRESKKLEQKLQSDIAKYDLAVQKQNARVKQENAKKDALAKEIAVLRNCYAQSRNYLDTVYGYDVIDPEYRNIYAVSSFYGYLKKGRTHGLQFDQQSGDQGAYNIYENERRLDLIITNTDEILRRMDQVIHNQHELAVGLENPSRQVKTLCSNVTQQLNTISCSVGAIERCQSIIAYNSECNARNLTFLSWMHTIY